MSDPRSHHSLFRPVPRPAPPAPQAAPPAPPSRRWLVSVGAAAGALLVALIVGQVYLFKVLSRRGEAGANGQQAGAPEQPRTDTPARDRDGRPPEQIVRGPDRFDQAAADQRKQDEKKADEKKAEEQKPQQPPRDDGREALLGALGTLTAAQLYQTYLNIGLLADATAKEVYPAATARKLLDEVTGMLDTVEGQVARVPEEALRPEDRKALARAREVAVLLRTQARELRAYWETDDEARVVKYQKAREEAWAGIKELLNVKE
jgi:hypothetical protein